MASGCSCFHEEADTTPPRKAPRDLSKKKVRDAHWTVEAKLTALKVLDMSTDAASNDIVILVETCE